MVAGKILGNDSILLESGIRGENLWEKWEQQCPHAAFLSGHLDTRESTMASDHQTQAGKPQPLNPKVGTLPEGEAGNLYMLSSLCRVRFLLLVPSLDPVPQGTRSPRAADLEPIPCVHPHPDVQQQLQTLNFSAYLLPHACYCPQDSPRLGQRPGANWRGF